MKANACSLALLTQHGNFRLQILCLLAQLLFFIIGPLNLSHLTLHSVRKVRLEGIHLQMNFFRFIQTFLQYPNGAQRFLQLGNGFFCLNRISHTRPFHACYLLSGSIQFALEIKHKFLRSVGQICELLLLQKQILPGVFKLILQSLDLAGGFFLDLVPVLEGKNQFNLRLVKLFAQRFDDLVQTSALGTLGSLGLFKNVIEVLKLARYDLNHLQLLLELSFFLFDLLKFAFLALQIDLPSGQLVERSLLPQDSGIQLHPQTVDHLSGFGLFGLEPLGQLVDAGFRAGQVFLHLVDKGNGG